jgi:argininosuccinate synthase
MDELGGFEPTDTTGFIQTKSIGIKKYVICSYQKLQKSRVVALIFLCLIWA